MRFDLDRLPTDPVLLQKMLREMAEIMELERAELGAAKQIGPDIAARVYLACGVTDMRKGITGMALLAQDHLRQKPTSGAVFAFRGRKGDLIKLLYWDGQGFCLYYKVLQRDTFPWPSSGDAVARLTRAQLAMLWEGIDWRRPSWGEPPARVG